MTDNTVDSYSDWTDDLLDPNLASDFWTGIRQLVVFHLK